jgi:hypothetical protein
MAPAPIKVPLFPRAAPSSGRIGISIDIVMVIAAMATARLRGTWSQAVGFSARVFGLRLSVLAHLAVKVSI